ncbi:MAG: YgiQ family radical SAM protein [Methylomonas sp.]|uniref:YgiQ family radical SAM protein n=1 Tax=Methylomonas sp. TaxID=418 RepID=UPI0025DB5006|nr:YgiQ family radical SAM protein [Methylomonas sp.]MCK9607149.1 YgiQ family radical SAM protein [Methylomonas sp.]
MNHNAANIFGYKKYWAQRFGPAPELPMSMQQMQQLGWDACDIILVTGDAYVDHPSFGMAVIGRVLEAQGFRVGIISQPDWHSAEDFKKLGQPKLFFGVTGGNMDSMVNRYTSDKKIRSNDAYTADGSAGRRPDRAVNVYSHRCREAFKNVPIIIGGIEASLRRIAHYDYWSDKVRKSIILDAKADLLVYGNGERQIVEIAHRLAKGENIHDLKGIRGTVHFVKQVPLGWMEKDSTDIDKPGAVIVHQSPYQEQPACEDKPKTSGDEKVIQFKPIANKQRAQTVIRLPDYEAVKDDPILYAHASRVMHGETNPGNARALIQRHGSREVWINPPPLPLTTPEMDGVFDLPYSRLPHTHYGKSNIPAFEMIQHSVLIMRGCFGGCSFCSITEHEGRIIQNRSEDSIIREIEAIRDTSPNFTGHISDLGGPTANMWRLACKDPEIEASCRKPSCVYPGICQNLNTDQTPLVKLYRRARKLPGIKKIFIASGLRYDLAVETPEYVKELVTHHVGGYLKIAPEHTEQGPLSKMMKPGMGSYDRFKQMFDKFSKEAGKEQYLIPYFIAAHPGTEDKDMLNLALWLKRNGFRADQVQAFLPSPMSIATAMYHSGKDTLHKVGRNVPDMPIPRSVKQRRIHKAFLRYHDPKNWPLLREALKDMGRADLIGNGKQHLIPSYQPKMAENPLDKSQPNKRPFTTKYNGIKTKSSPPKLRRSK